MGSRLCPRRKEEPVLSENRGEPRKGGSLQERLRCPIDGFSRGRALLEVGEGFDHRRVHSHLGVLFEMPLGQDRRPKNRLPDRQRLFQVVETPGDSVSPSQEKRIPRVRLPRRGHSGDQGQPGWILCPLPPGLPAKGPGGARLAAVAVRLPSPARGTGGLGTKHTRNEEAPQREPPKAHRHRHTTTASAGARTSNNNAILLELGGSKSRMTKIR
mmetsp:Transcript_4110/g.8962  ORF Transcript_4110/g.8962 Transcript_4110/m.8962 type:complete len:214 (-) Transcript_4110:1794-2435(-)